MKKLSFLFVAILGCIVLANAQAPTEYLAAADKYFAAGDYYSAAQYYEKHLTGKKPKNAPGGFSPYAVTAAVNKKLVVTSKTKEQVIYNLAESYRNLHFHDKSAPHYQTATGFNKSLFPLARFHYASTLRALGRNDEAAAEFVAFTQEYTSKDQYAAIAALEIENIAYIKQQMARKTLSAYKLEKNGGLNAEGGSYAPVWIDENNLWFTSTRPWGDNKSTSNRIYQSTYSNGVAGAPSVITISQPKDIQQGVVSISPDGNTIFLTRWDVEKNKKSAAIYTSKKVNGNWAEPTAVTALDAAGSNSQQPFVMPDGKTLVFSSDRPGGLGGFDLWKAYIDPNGNVGAPENMGERVNTAFDEQAPSYHAASQTFVFSSNGRVGMGGYDFFFSKGTIDNLSAPQNFGYPVNSIKDDLYFTSKGPARNILEDVIISSDREAACCLELFSLSKPKPIKQLSGLVLDCSNNQPLANAKVTVMDTINNKVITELTTDAEGRYSFTLEDYQPLKATASDSGYFNNSVHLNTPFDIEEEKYASPDLCLTLIPSTPEETITVDNVYYDFNSAALQKTSYPSLDRLVQLLKDNPAVEIELNAHTDSKGDEDYNQRLSDARAKAVVNYLISKGINKNRLTSKGFGETMPVADNSNEDGTDNPEGRQQNRRTEFKVLEK